MTAIFDILHNCKINQKINRDIYLEESLSIQFNVKRFTVDWWEFGEFGLKEESVISAIRGPLNQNKTKDIVITTIADENMIWLRQ